MPLIAEVKKAAKVLGGFHQFDVDTPDIR